MENREQDLIPFFTDSKYSGYYCVVPLIFMVTIVQPIYVTGFGKTRHMGFFVKIKFDVYLISSSLELTYLQV